MTSHVDGNVLAGALAELFQSDITCAVAQCTGCGDRSALALAMVYTDEMGLVARCAHCDSVLITVMDTGTSTCIDLHGITGLQVFRA